MKGITAAAMALGVSLSYGVAAKALNGQGGVNMGEWGLRQSATTAPMPEYPRESLAQKVSGVVVAAVLFGVDGKLTTIEILESPDAHTVAAVRDAVGRWIVPGAQVMGREGKSPITGKLTFYFQVRDGEGAVLDPDQMPGGPPRPAPRPKPSSPPAGPRAGPPPAGPPAAPPVTSGGHGAVNTVTVQEFKKQSRDALVVDVGDRNAFKRGHWPGAVNIPYDEIGMRGGVELPRDKTIVIDCTQEQTFYCDVAAWRLADQKFPNVVLLVR
jgi:rhodanese-related sulfurtransferase